jgi:outer membrane protein assembly factor BamB
MKNKLIQTRGADQQKPLLLWPGIVIVLLQWLVRFGLPLVIPGDTVTQIGVFGGVLGGLAFIIWWAFFSRARWFDRLGAILLMIVSLVITSLFLDVSIKTTMMGMMFPVYSIPILCLAFVIGIVLTRNLLNRPRRLIMAAIIVLVSGCWVFIRSNGMTGSAQLDFAWRWSKTPEERLLSQSKSKISKTEIASEATKTEAEWPGFRGLNRDGIIHRVQIKTDWTKTPPVEMWRRSVGPGCSSFAIHDAFLFTQEQRGEYEMVTCYKLNTGEPVWMHSDSIRFWDSHAGAGPRSTPTLSEGRVYTLGATGLLNVLNEIDGSVVWSHNAEKDTDVKLPVWGYTSSPVVTDSVVIVAISGKVLAYDIATGNLRWSAPDGGSSYSSPHLLTIDGIKQVLFLSQKNMTSFDPSNGKELWTFPFEGIMSQIVQPSLINKNDILINAGDEKGMIYLTIKNEPGGWSVKKQWESEALKPYFNDFIVHDGYAYGFDGPNMACMDLKDGKRLWRGNRYRGWLLLLSDQDLLIVLSEQGELALVKATPDKFTEIARIPAIKGKTWNHPAMVGNILVVRNAQEMAAFRLPVTDNKK